VSWSEILKVALSTGIFAAIITSGLQWLREWRTERTHKARDAAYSAMRVAVILERFAIDCANIISDNHLHSSSGGHAGSAHVELPHLIDYPADTDWKALDAFLAMRALSLRNDILLSEGVLNFHAKIERSPQISV
jgi:hypothetical protein